MFYHRVLPPPPILPDSRTRSSSVSTPVVPISGGTHENTMMTIAERSAVSHVDSGRLRDYAIKNQGQHQYNRHSRDAESPTSATLRSSSRLAHKIDRSRSPSAASQQPSQTRLPSISKEGDLNNPDSPPHVCLCQPDPKVPRPRNAFILFRQHHQAAVVAQNPGLANPDISKIIGDAWRTSASDIKDHWKGLAEEEKVRHQKLYPDYRYQPRRAGRNSLTNSVATDPETQRCLKCGGKAMQTYNSLPTPGSPTSPRTTPPNPSMGGNAILSRGQQYIGSPAYPPGAVDLRRFPTSNAISPLAFRQRDTHEPGGPDSKRRRYNGPVSPPTRPGSVAYPPSFSQPGRRPSMPHPETLTRGHSLSISRTHPGSGNPIRPTGPALAPLQIDKNQDIASQIKAVEAMVMSIPALNKIKVLSKISPPLHTPGPASPPHAIRGALIAIEGSDEEAIKCTTVYLREYLERDGDYKVRLLVKSIDKPFEDNASWLDNIATYHKESREIIKYITTIPTTKSQDILLELRRGSEVSSCETAKIAASDDDESMSSPPESPVTEIRSSNPFGQARHPIPIIIAPKYQLSLTDLAASQIAINDEYSPTDHWQWMATLWRGIVGPDVTIDVKTSHSGPSETSSPRNAATGSSVAPAPSKSSDVSPITVKDVNMTGVSSSSGGSGGAVGQLSSRNPPLVDVRLHDARAVFLRSGLGGQVAEASLRRMGFEVGEWLRDVESREREREAREKGR